MAQGRNLTFVGFLLRFVFALLLVFITYNPSGYSFYDWVAGFWVLGFADAIVYKVFIGILLLIGWAMYIRATWESLGWFGMCLAFAFFSTIVWMSVEWGFLNIESPSAWAWMIGFVAVGVLATGMSWSFIREKVSGQTDTVDDK